MTSTCSIEDTGTSSPDHSYNVTINLINGHGFYLLSRRHMGPDGSHKWVAELRPHEY